MHNNTFHTSLNLYDKINVYLAVDGTQPINDVDNKIPGPLTKAWCHIIHNLIVICHVSDISESKVITMVELYQLESNISQYNKGLSLYRNKGT